MSHKPQLILISGSPGTGKTTFGKTLASRYKLMFLYKDGIKEELFDGLGWTNREWSKKLGMVSYKLLFHVAEAVFAAGHSCIIESNFSKELDAPVLAKLQKKYDFEIVEIVCTADSTIAFERFKSRAESSDRHPGHQDKENLEEFAEVLKNWKHESLGLSSSPIIVDTSDYTKAKYDEVFSILDAVLLT